MFCSCTNLLVRMIPINACKFPKDLMQILTCQHGTEYTLTCDFLPPICIYEYEVLYQCVEEIARAVRKIAWFEQYIRDEELLRLQPNIANSQSYLRNFFAGSNNRCNFSEHSPYSAFNFIRYMSYVSSSAIYNHMQGSVNALDYASLEISRMIYSRADIFRDLTAWEQLAIEARRINLDEFVYPGLNWILPPTL